MYFLNLKKLMKNIESSSEFCNESYKYLIAYIISLGTLKSIVAVMLRNSFSSHDLGAYGVLWPLAWSVVVIANLLYLRHANGGRAGQRFVDKLLQLQWVIFWRTYLIFIPIFIFFLIILSVVLKRMDTPSFHIIFVAVAMGLSSLPAIYVVIRTAWTLQEIHKKEIRAS
jgi:hypothetical protein